MQVTISICNECESIDLLHTIVISTVHNLDNLSDLDRLDRAVKKFIDYFEMVFTDKAIVVTRYHDPIRDIIDLTLEIVDGPEEPEESEKDPDIPEIPDDKTPEVPDNPEKIEGKDKDPESEENNGSGDE